MINPEFTEEELQIMLLDYESLMRVTKMMNRVVIGNNQVRDALIDDDITRMNILKKLRKVK